MKNFLVDFYQEVFCKIQSINYFQITRMAERRS